MGVGGDGEGGRGGWGDEEEKTRGGEEAPLTVTDVALLVFSFHSSFIP